MVKRLKGSKLYKVDVKDTADAEDGMALASLRVQLYANISGLVIIIFCGALSHILISLSLHSLNLLPAEPVRIKPEVDDESKEFYAMHEKPEGEHIEVERDVQRDGSPVQPGAFPGVPDEEGSLPNANPPADKCEPKTDIFYLRVHKTGSATMTNILYRYALRHNLSVIPMTRDPYPDRAIRKYVMRMNGQALTHRKYNIFAERVIFNERHIAPLLHGGAIYLASVREPVDQFYSAFKEVQMLHFNVDGNGSSASEQAKRFLLSEDQWNRNSKMKELSNMMARDFGMDLEQTTDKAYLKKYVDYLLHRFSMVVLTEHFDESLALLRRKLCWNLEDMVYLPQNVRTPTKSRSRHLKDDHQAVEQHKRFSPADHVLYHRISRTFRTWIQRAQSKDYVHELEQLQELQTKVAEYCHGVLSRIREFSQNQTNPVIHELAGNREEKTIVLSSQRDHVISAIDCAVMRLKPNVMSNILRMRQMRAVCITPSIIHVHLHETYLIRWGSRNMIYMSHLYCSKWDDYYNLPLNVLATRGVYAWD